ncbi:hypothetical protein H4Q26_018377 [Puccinia striiformis f. sp. tritici PST-130]|nr:hypothetical protein Pst134EB_006317 [Puccinia striiformis f. sp. tritici]KAI9628969.1 hypothetical protein H4Q26_018377 [Puccinia striiformis f. sp. tritici PST-130]
MSEDDNEPNHGPRTSKADAYSACGSLDGFIQPPPPHVAAAYHAIGPEDFQRMYPTNCTAERMPSEEPMPASPMPAATPCQATQVADNPLIESMLALAQLSQADLQLGRQLFNAPEEIRWKLSVIMWLSRRPTPSTVHNAVPTNGLAPFVYSQVIRVRVRQRIREILFRSSLESYSRLQSLQGEPLIHSPLPLIKMCIALSCNYF